MTLKNYLKIFFISLITGISLIPIGGYCGHHLKFLAATIIYFGLSIFFLPKTKTTKEVLLVVFLIALPPSLFYIPIHLKNFTETQIAFISTLGHFVGIVFGIITHFVSGKMKIVVIALLLISTIWVTFLGFAFWLHKANFGTFTGKVYYDKPVQILGQNQYGQKLSDSDFKNKTILIDFWHTRCGVCFQKFPKLQEIFDTFKMDTSIVIIAINKPLKQDTTGQAFAVLKEKGYSFPVLIPLIDTLPEMFNVQNYPTTFIIDKSGKIIFKGDIENAKSIMSKLTKPAYNN